MSKKEEIIDEVIEDQEPQTSESIDDDNAEELLKTMMDAGKGLLQIARDKVESALADLIEKGKITTEDGDDAVEQFISDTKKAGETFEQKAKEIRDQFFTTIKEKSDDIDLPVSRKEISKLNERLIKIEGLLTQKMGGKTDAKDSEEA